MRTSASASSSPPRSRAKCSPSPRAPFATSTTRAGWLTRDSTRCWSAKRSYVRRTRSSSCGTSEPWRRNRVPDSARAGRVHDLEAGRPGDLDGVVAFDLDGQAPVHDRYVLEPEATDPLGHCRREVQAPVAQVRF